MKIPHIAAIFVATLLMSGCGGRKADDKPRADYSLSLGDSIEVMRTEIDSCNRAIASLKESQDIWLRDFTTVDNSREAAPYIIYSSFRDKYPPATTSVMARLADNGQFEIVAALAGARFSSITVTAPDVSASSETVPPDQALNYMAGNLNTVLFTGPKADSIGRLISDNELNNISVTFVNNGPVKSWSIPDSYKKMLSATFRLYDAQRQINTLERRVPMLNRKINILREHLEKNNPKP